MIKFLIVTFCLILSLFTIFSANASVKCPVAKVSDIRTIDGRLMMKLDDQNWHVIALTSDKDYKKKFARAFKAKRKNLLVELTFPNGYDKSCMISNPEVTAKKIKLIKSKK